MMKKRWIVLGLCVVAVAALAAGAAAAGASYERSNTQNTISLTGVVDTENGRKVYSTLEYLVESVNVEVGDVVEEGNVLAKLETRDLELDIAQQQAALNVKYDLIPAQLQFSNEDYYGIEQAKQQLSSAMAAVDDAKENYNIASDQLDDNVDYAEEALSSAKATLTNAQASYDSAKASLEEALEKAKQTFEEQKAAYEKAATEWAVLEEGYLGDIEDYIEDVENAEEKLRTEFPGSDSPTYQPDPSEKDKYSKLVNEIIDAKEDLQEVREVYVQKKATFQQIQDGYNQALNDYQSQVASIASSEEVAKSSVEDAQSIVAAAEAQLNSAKQAQNGVEITRLEQEISSAVRDVDSAELQKQYAEDLAESNEQLHNALTSAVQSDRVLEIGIQRLQNMLSEATITAPISGVVTAVYAKEGEPGNGLLFVIEDTESLKIITHIQEGDIGRVTEGMKVTIRSQATGDKEIPGTITYIAPAAGKTDAGTTAVSDDSSAAEFEAEVRVDAQDTGLLIGMNTTLTVLLDEPNE